MKKFIRRISNEKTVLFIILIFIIGLLIGVVFANQLDHLQQSELNQYIYNGVKNLKEIKIYYNEYFFKNMFSHIKLLLAVWILGFFSYGYIVVFALIFLKGFLYGFTEAFLTSQFNINGLLLGFVSYLPQNLIFIPVLFILCKTSIQNSLNKTKRNVSVKNNKHILVEYLLLLAISIVCFILGTIIETYVTPILIKYFVKMF